MKSLALAQRMLGRPLALTPDRMEVVRHLLAHGSDDMAMFGPIQEKADRDPVLGTVISDVAVIPVSGVLLPGESPGWWWSGATFYEDINVAFQQAIDDPSIKVVVLLVDSPGGTVAGCFDLADRIYEGRGAKPIVAIVNESAYSAAYALASSADTIVVPRTGGVGSIGVVGMHVDITGALEQAGIKITTFQFGDQKTDSYPTTTMSEEAAKRFQADIDAMGELFVATVARNRDIPADRVRATQAGTFLGQTGVDAGLADTVMGAEAAFRELLDTIG
ncbi:S49 family peptidase [Novacetimonas sp. GS1]|uniref:S49 family peptidase n=1 Tax=Novacetimonas sp. GS1 TaxID=3119990 RepID=UPI002FCD2FC9